MAEELLKRIKQFPNDYLLEQYTRKRHEYTPEALEIMREELEERNIFENADSPESAGGSFGKESTVKRYEKEDFIALDGNFSRMDLVLAQAVLRDRRIPFYLDGPATSSVLPLEDEMSQSYVVNVLKERLKEAVDAIEEHFEELEGAYALKNQGTKDRLRSFNFHEIPHYTEGELEEELEVEFSEAERQVLLELSGRLIKEADTIEKETGRMLFYYDGIEELRQSINDPKRYPLRRMDLFAALEVLQVYCDGPEFPQSMESVAEGLLEFATG